jgi:hypothetical protein
MAFNSHTYHVNKARKSAWENLAEARSVRDSAKPGVTDFDKARINHLVQIARMQMRYHLTLRAIGKR